MGVSLTMQLSLRVSQSLGLSGQSVFEEDATTLEDDGRYLTMS